MQEIRIAFNMGEYSTIYMAIRYYFIHQATPEQQTEIRRNFAPLLNQEYKFTLTAPVAKELLDMLNYYREANISEQFLDDDAKIHLNGATNKIKQYLRLNEMVKSPLSKIKKKLLHDVSMIKHTFIREALDNIFHGMTFNIKQGRVYFTSIYNAIAINTMASQEFKQNGNEHRKLMVIPIDIKILQSKIKHHRGNLNESRVAIQKLQKMAQNGKKYLILHNSEHQLSLSTVDQNTALQFIKVMLDLLDKSGDKI